MQPLPAHAARQGSPRSASHSPGRPGGQGPRALHKQRSLRKRSVSLPAAEPSQGEQAAEDGGGLDTRLSASAVPARQPQGDSPSELKFDAAGLPGLGTWAQRQFNFQPQVRARLPALSTSPSALLRRPPAGQCLPASACPARPAPG